MELRTRQREEGIVQVELIGRLDVAGMHEVDARFHEETAGAGKPTLVDLSRLDFIASLGMGMLISCAQSLARKGAKMVLLNPQPEVHAVLRMAGIDEAIPLAQSEREALAQLGVVSGE